MGVEVLRDRAAVLLAGVPVTALVRGPDLLKIMLVVCHTAAAADAVFVIVMHRGHKDVEVDPIAVSRIPDVMRLQRPQSTAMNGQMLPDVRLVGDKEGAAGLGLQGEFGTVGLAADDGPCEDLVGDSTPSGVSRTRVLAAPQPVGGTLRRCDRRGRFEAVRRSSLDDCAAFRGLDGHVERADPAAVVARRGDDGNVGLFIAAGAVAGFAAVGLAGGLDIDGETLLPVMAQRVMGVRFCVRSIAFAGVFHLARGGAGGRDGLRLAPVVAQCGGVLGLTVPAALPLAGGGGRSRFGAGSGGGRFQIMAQRGKHGLLLLHSVADSTGDLLAQATLRAGSGSLRGRFPITAAVPMLIGQHDRQVFPDVIDVETPIGAFKYDLLVFIDGVAVIVAARFLGVALVVIRKAAAGRNLEGLGDAVIKVESFLDARGGKGLGLNGDGLFRQRLGLHGKGVARFVRRGHLQPDFAVVQRRQLSVRTVQLDIIQRDMDKAVFVHLAIYLIQAPAPVAVSGRKVRQIILRGVLYDQPGILRAIRGASDVDRRLAVIPLLVDIDFAQFFAILGSIQTKRHRRIHICIADPAITRLHEPSWRCLNRDRGCKEDVVQIQICRREKARFVPVDLAGGSLIHDEGILRLEVEVLASKAIGNDLFVVIGRTGPEFVGVQRFVVTRKNIHPELVVGADVERMASGGLIDGPVHREIQLIRERIAAVVPAVLIPVGPFHSGAHTPGRRTSHGFPRAGTGAAGSPHNM